MNKLKIKTFLFLILGISASLWFAISIYRGIDISNFLNFVKILPSVVTIDTILITLFIKYGWKWKVFKYWLVTTPNLNGTWIGKIHTNWRNPETGEKPNPIPVMLTIKQSFHNISCIMRTGEMKSNSISAGIEIDNENQIKLLSYIYTSKPRALVQNRSNQHDGAIIFDIIEEPKLKLDGKYWTERNTSGEIILQYYSKNLLEELPVDFEKHPVTEQENRT